MDLSKKLKNIDKKLNTKESHDTIVIQKQSISQKLLGYYPKVSDLFKSLINPQVISRYPTTNRSIHTRCNEAKFTWMPSALNNFVSVVSNQTGRQVGLEIYDENISTQQQRVTMYYNSHFEC